MLSKPTQRKTMNFRNFLGSDSENINNNTIDDVDEFLSKCLEKYSIKLSGKEISQLRSMIKFIDKEYADIILNSSKKTVKNFKDLRMKIEDVIVIGELINQSSAKRSIMPNIRLGIESNHKKPRAVAYSIGYHFRVSTENEKYIDIHNVYTNLAIPSPKKYSDEDHGKVILFSDYGSTANILSALMHLEEFDQGISIGELVLSDGYKIPNYNNMQHACLCINLASCYIGRCRNSDNAQIEEYCKRALHYLQKAEDLDNQKLYESHIIYNRNSINKGIYESYDDLSCPILYDFFIDDYFQLNEGPKCEFKNIIDKDLKGTKDLGELIRECVPKTICSFMNSTKGGRLFFGIEDKNNTINGIELKNEELNNTKSLISQKLNLIYPSINEYYGIEFHKVLGVSNIYIIEIYIKPTKDLNVFYVPEKNRHIPYIRVENTIHIMSPQEIENRFREKYQINA